MKDPEDISGKNWDALALSAYLSAGDIEGRDVTFTIAGAEIRELPTDKGETDKAVLLLRGPGAKPFVLCRTNRECIQGMFGAAIRDCIGKRITVYATDVKVGKETKRGIRLRGSPDLPRAITVTVSLPRRRPFDVPLKVTARDPGDE